MDLAYAPPRSEGTPGDEARPAASGPAAVAVVVGSLALDTIVLEAERSGRLGGAVTYAGLTYRRLGLGARALFNLAEEDRGAVRALEREGVDLRIGPSAETTRFVNRIEGERRTQEVPSRARPILAAAVREGIAGCSIVHLGPLHADDVEIAAGDALRGTAALVGLDVQGLVRRISSGGVTHVLRPLARRLLERCRVVKGDEDEVAALVRGLGLTRVEEVPGALAIDELLVTAGSRGGRVFTAEGSVAWKADPAHDRGDSTGAGDVFLAAYLVGRAVRGLAPDEAASGAARVAARQVAGAWIEVATLAL